MRRFPLLIACAITLFCGMSDAAEITAEQAKTAVRNWRAREAAPMGTAVLGQTVRGVSTIADRGGTAPLFHVVRLEEGGFVVTAADDGITPIIMFSGDGDLDPSPANPLWTLLNTDMAQRKTALTGVLAAQGMAAPKMNTHAPDSPKAQWAALLDERGIPKGLSAVSDVRVSPFVQARWGQEGLYNRYAFKNGSDEFPVGCVGVCGAQIMRHFRFPIAAVTPGMYACAVNGVETGVSMKGGFYSWSSMPDALGSLSSDSSSLAVSKLIFDVATASYTSWEPESSSATMEALTLAFTERFHYLDAQVIREPSATAMRNAILANLDFGIPVGLGIHNSGAVVGHAVVADGYGYHNNTLYCHLNMGWSGAYDAWYNLPIIDVPDDGYNVLSALIFNISTEYANGAYCTGRILDRNGNPAAGATFEVAYRDGSKSGPHTVNSKGMYAFHASFSGASAALTVNALLPGYKGSASVTLQQSAWDKVGNRWGLDIRADTPTPYVITLNPNGGSGGTASVNVGMGSYLPDRQTAPSRAGYTFLGYYTTSAPDGGTRYYDSEMNGTTVWNDISVATLYARWSANTYTATLNPNSGVGGTPSVSVTYDAALPPASAPTRTGYAFTGYFDAGGAQYYSPSMSGVRPWNKPGNTTLYAGWAPNTYSVTFDAQGGTVTPSTRTVTFDSTLGVLPVPALDGLYFAGWWTVPGGAGTRVTRFTRLTSEGLTLYAYWVSDPALAQYQYLSDPGNAGATPVWNTAYEGFSYDAQHAVRGTVTLSVKTSIRKTQGTETTNWTFTAKAILQNATVNFSAKTWHGAAGDLSITAKTGETLTLRVERNRFWGTLTDGRVGDTLYVDGVRNVFADRKDAAAQTRLNTLKGCYTMALCSVIDSPMAEPAGYLSLTVWNSGTVKIAGKLPNGTAVSGSGKLLEGLSNDDWLAIALFKPLFMKKGHIGALLWLDPETKVIRTDRDYGWFTTVKKAEGPAQELDAVGGFYNPVLAGAKPAYRLSAYVDAPLAVALPNAVPLIFANGKLALANKALTPKLDKKAGAYVYDPVNPAQATLTFTPKTGLFKGSFKLWHDTYGANGKLTHKAVTVPYAGVIVTTKDAAFTETPSGLGHCLVPGANRAKHPWPVWIE